jgi:deoxycytidylate deaminase
MPRYAPTIASTALAAIQQHGPQSLDQLASHVVAAGMTRARDPLRAVEAAIVHDSRFIELGPGGLAAGRRALPAVVRGSVGLRSAGEAG